jgi:cytochrome c2
MTKMSKTALLSVSFAIVLSAPTQAADVAQGEALHAAKCTGCHDTRQYTRPNRIIHSLEDLHARVKFCDGMANANFSADNIDDVVAYLNANFYQFKQ